MSELFPLAWKHLFSLPCRIFGEPIRFAENARAHRAEKWTRISAPNGAQTHNTSTGWIPKAVSTFGSDALVDKG
jgi:hypothetical protein